MSKCYYDTLGVARTATAEEIRKAYKVKALLLHPDKNHDRLEAATQEFAYLQQCYSVLSDPHERTWYDNHRDAILKSAAKSGAAHAPEEDDSVLDLMPLFNSTAYKGFTDGPQGFFTVFRKVFEDIETEEKRAATANAAAMDGGPAKLQPSLTSFGYSGTSYMPFLDEFYRKWTSFLSVKSFSFCDAYYAHASYNRDQRRYLDKENKKARDAARKEYSETVRSLALYLKKRDPRVLLYKSTMAKQQEERKQQQKASMKEKRQTLQDAVLPDWSQIDEDQYRTYFSELVSSASDQEGDGEASQSDEFSEFFCDACRKNFKSVSQWENHEKSKKHLKAIKALKKQFRKEEKLLGIQKRNMDYEESDTEEEEAVDGYSVDEKPNEPEPDADDAPLQEVSFEEDEEDIEESSEGQSFDAEVVEHSAEQSRHTTSDNSSVFSEPTSDIDLETLLEQIKLEREALENPTEEKPADKKKKRRAAKPKKEPGNPTQASTASAASASGAVKCQTCKASFPSRNALFKHIKLKCRAAYK